ncbi:hypothetical protein Gohar_000715, partial [Gossypium harknessii]|nr:hypothetical protein [Gossypium harknessii]
MSEKMWDVTIKHAKTCVMGNKYYVFQGTNYRVFLNPICQLVKAEINGTTYPIQTLSSINREAEDYDDYDMEGESQDEDVMAEI